MGWTVLYIAFGVVALWLLGEVLLQYKARLRWRLVAFCGFLGVVIGVLLPSVPVIAAGAVAFAIGQTFVTLSFRRGFSTGWALGGKPGTSRRRRDTGQEMRPLEPLPDDPQAGAADYDAYGQGTPDGGQPEGPYQGQYEEPSHDGQYEGQPPREQPDLQDGGYGQEIYPEPPQYQPSTGYPDPYQDPYGAQDPSGYPEQPAAEPYEPAYAAYSDPYIGGAGALGDQGAAGEQYADYGTQPFQAGFPPEFQPEQQTYAASYASDYPAQAAFPTESYYSETPPDGVWVPQQRDPDPAAEATAYGYPQPEPYPQAQAQPQPQAEGYYFDQGQRY
jgi:hypothetical protein